MRAYVTGTTSTSIWTHYERGERVFCGHRLPDGLKKHQKLPDADPHADDQGPQGRARRVAARARRSSRRARSRAKDFDEAAEIAMKLFAAGQTICAERGLILVDTKYEFGRTTRRPARRHRRDPHARLVALLAARAPTTSASRAGQDPEPLDKDFVRRWYIAAGLQGRRRRAARCRTTCASARPSATSRRTSRSRARRSCPTSSRRSRAWPRTSSLGGAR